MQVRGTAPKYPPLPWPPKNAKLASCHWIQSPESSTETKIKETLDCPDLDQTTRRIGCSWKTYRELYIVYSNFSIAHNEEVKNKNVGSSEAASRVLAAGFQINI